MYVIKKNKQLTNGKSVQHQKIKVKKSSRIESTLIWYSQKNGTTVQMKFRVYILQ